MYRFKSIRFFKLIFLFFITVNLNGQGSPNSDRYTIQIDQNVPKKILVQCVLNVQDSLLYMSSIGANQFPSRWAYFVHGLKAENLNGISLKVDTLGGAQWRIHSPHNSRVKLTYEIHLDHENFKWNGGIDGAAYTRDWGLFFTGRSIFIMSGEQKEDLHVRFILPKEWQVSTPWEKTDDSNLEFLVRNQITLSDGMFFAGTHEEVVIKRDDFELIFAFGGEEIVKQKKAFSEMAEGVLDYYIDLMGGVPNPAPDNKFSKVLVVMNSSSQTDGEVIGNNISILLEKDGDAMSQLVARFLFAHEFFHLWNGKSFTPEGEDCEWFKEGFTNYYTLKSLFHIGFLNEQSYLSVLDNFFYQRYHNDKGVGELSLTQGDQKHDHWGLIYSGGFFAGISQDMIIRSSTENKMSIDHVMKSLFEKYGGTNDRYTLEELKSLMSNASGKDQSTFFNTYIKGSKRVPLDYYLNMGGFEAKEADGKILIRKKDEQTLMEAEISNGLFGIN